MKIIEVDVSQKKKNLDYKTFSVYLYFRINLFFQTAELFFL